MLKTQENLTFSEFMSGSNNPAKQTLSLSTAAELILEECRMVLPGIQALFGFQLIAVFSDGFEQKLDSFEQILHLIAIGLVVTATALIMAPAAYHRQTSPLQITEKFIKLATRLLLWSMLPLALGICIDFYLIAQIILDNSLSLPLTAALFAIFLILWFALPRMRNW